MLGLARFTFHYGPIQIVNTFYLTKIAEHLHSTMVLFKLTKDFHLYTLLSKFTFHYGPIQIKWTINIF